MSLVSFPRISLKRYKRKLTYVVNNAKLQGGTSVETLLENGPFLNSGHTYPLLLCTPTPSPQNQYFQVHIVERS